MSPRSLRTSAIGAFALAALLAAFGAAPGRAQQAGGSPAPAASESMPPLPSPQPTAEDPKIHMLAVRQFLDWQQGTVDRSLYSDQVNAELTTDAMDKAGKALANMGGLQSATFLGISHTKKGDLYVYHMVCDRGAVDMDFGLDTQGKIAIIFFE